MKQLSVIIPAYQAEASLEKCVVSILANHMDLEILIANDGSTDMTEMICHQLAEKDSRVRFWTKENAGPGAAREFAVKYASGEYITFVDSDDYLLPQAYDQILENVQNHFDIIEYGYQKVHTDGSIIAKVPMLDELFHGDECGLHYAKQINTTNFLWNKLFRHSLFQKVEFVHLFTGEDTAVLAQLYVYAKHCCVISLVAYCYVMTPNSLCRAPFSAKKLDGITAYWFIDRFYQKHAPELVFYARQKLCSLCALLYSEGRRSDMNDADKLCGNLVKEYRKAKQGISLKKLLSHGSWHRKMMLLMFEISPQLCAAIYNWHHSRAIPKNRPLAKLRRTVKIAEAGNQRKEEKCN